MVKVPTHCSRCYYTGWPQREVLEKVLGGQKIPPLACRDGTGVGAGGGRSVWKVKSLYIAFHRRSKIPSGLDRNNQCRK